MSAKGQKKHRSAAVVIATRRENVAALYRMGMGAAQITGALLERDKRVEPRERLLSEQAAPYWCVYHDLQLVRAAERQRLAVMTGDPAGVLFEYVGQLEAIFQVAMRNGDLREALAAAQARARALGYRLVEAVGELAHTGAIAIEGMDSRPLSDIPEEEVLNVFRALGRGRRGIAGSAAGNN